MSKGLISHTPKGKDRRAARERYYLLFIVASLVVKLWLSATTSHYDLWLTQWQALQVANGNWNLYDYLPRERPDAILRPPHPPAAYPFGFYGFSAAWQMLITSLGLIDLQGWNHPAAIPEATRAWWAMMFKLPYWLTDIAIGLVLARMFGTPAWVIWTGSVTGLYLLLTGQNDLYPAFFVTGAAALAYAALRTPGTPRARWCSVGSMALIGIGATFKIAPLFLALPFALLLGRSWRARSTLFLVALTPFALLALPFLQTPAFVNGVLFNFEGIAALTGSGGRTHFLSQPAPLFLVTYLVLIISLALRPASATPHPTDVWASSVIAFGSLFLFSSTVFYWLVWMMPLLIGFAFSLQRTGALMLWTIIELSFAAMRVYHHPDLFVRLWASAAPDFALHNVSSILSFTGHETLHRVVETLQVGVQATHNAGLLSAVGLAALTLLLQPTGSQAAVRPAHILALAVLPISTFFILLSANVLIARGFALEAQYLRPQRDIVTLTQEAAITQTLRYRYNTLSGVLIESQPVQPKPIFRLCVSANIHLSKPVCASSRSFALARWDTTGQSDIVIFDPPIVVAPDGDALLELTITLASESPASLANLPVFYPPPEREARFADLMAVTSPEGERRIGSLRTGLLRVFSLRRSASDIWTYLTRDARVMIALVICSVSVWGITALVLRRWRIAGAQSDLHP